MKEQMPLLEKLLFVDASRSDVSLWCSWNDPEVWCFCEEMMAKLALRDNNCVCKIFCIYSEFTPPKIEWTERSVEVLPYGCGY